MGGAAGEIKNKAKLSQKGFRPLNYCIHMTLFMKLEIEI